jgi:hypothetical protein
MTDPGKVGIFGASGYGKTTLAYQLVTERPRVIVFDPLDQWGPDFGLPSFEDGEAFKTALATAWYGSCRLAYVPRAECEPLELDQLARFLLACQAPYKRGLDPRPITLVIEEMDLSYPVHALPAGYGGMATLCNRGRHYGVELIGLSQYPAQVSTRFRANMDQVYSFNLPFDAHRKSLVQNFGARIDELGQLRPHRYLHAAGGAVESGCNAARKSSPGMNFPR